MAAVLASTLTFAGCGGGGGSHTYVFAASGMASGMYVTVTVPMAIPDSAWKNQKGVTRVDSAQGPKVCKFETKISGLKGEQAKYNGTTATIQINGTNPFIGMACAALSKSTSADLTQVFSGG